MDAELTLTRYQALYKDPISALFLTDINAYQEDWQDVDRYATSFFDHKGQMGMDEGVYDLMQFLLVNYQTKRPRDAMPYQLLGRLEESFGRDPKPYYQRVEEMAKKGKK